MVNGQSGLAILSSDWVMQGNGSGFMKPITRLILGDWVPANTELLKMSVTSKECAAAAALLLGHDLGSAAVLKHCHTSLTCLLPRYLPLISMDLLYLSIVSTFVLVKLSSVLAQPLDPFLPLESLVCWAGLGGLWDNIQSSDGVKDE